MHAEFATTAVLGAAFTFLLAGFVKGIIGMGLPTVAMGLLSVIMAPIEAAALLIVPSFVTNVWQLAMGPRLGLLARRLWPMMAGIVIGTLAGKNLMRDDPGGRAAIALGAALIVYGILGLAVPRFSISRGAERWLSPIVGAATGLVTAATGVFVIPAVPYLGALELSFTVSTVALAAILAGNGAFDLPLAGGSVLALIPAFVGMVAGTWVRGRVSETVFRRCFFAGLILLGMHLASRAVF